MFAGTGSTMSAATVPSFASKSDAISSRSLKGAITVSRAAPAVTPGVLGIAEGREPAAGAAREQRVGVTVVAALELDQGVLAGRGASEPDRRHRGLGARRRRAAPVRPRAPSRRSAPRAGPRPRWGRRRRCLATAASTAASTISFRAWPNSECSPRLAEVDVPRAVGVLEVGALASDGEPRDAADRTERADRRVHAAGDRSLRSLEELVGSAHGRSVYGCRALWLDAARDRRPRRRPRRRRADRRPGAPDAGARAR